MRSHWRNLKALVLFLTTSQLLHCPLITHGASTSPPVKNHHIKFSSFGIDYDNEMTTSPPDVVSFKRTTVLKHGPPKPCKLDPCLENQEPCETISERSFCLCPGVSRSDEPPRAPRLKVLQPVTSGADIGKIEVQWCAPSSVVSRYRVVIEGREGDALEFGGGSRRGLMQSVEVGTKVCIEAVNGAGISNPSDHSCQRFDHSESSDHKLLVGIIGGGVALLVILIIGAVILWKYQMHKKAKGDSTDGLGNPSYSTQGSL